MVPSSSWAKRIGTADETSWSRGLELQKVRDQRWSANVVGEGTVCNTMHSEQNFEEDSHTDPTFRVQQEMQQDHGNCLSLADGRYLPTHFERSRPG